MKRCDWAGPEQIYIDYHDTDWGVPEYDSRALWEKLILDGFQAGLSWITILKKRENFREAFAGFDPNVIADWGEADVERLFKNPGIIRHRGKIEATITNARVWQDIERREGFDTYLWNFVGGAPVQNHYATHGDVPTWTDTSKQISSFAAPRSSMPSWRRSAWLTIILSHATDTMPWHRWQCVSDR